MKRGFAEILLSKEYAVDAGSIPGNTTDYEVNIGDIEKILQVIIINDGGATINVKFNSTADDVFPLYRGEDLPISKIDFSKIYLTNPGGAAQPYRILTFGV